MILCLLLLSAQALATEIRVSPTGDDAGDGSEATPVATPQRAQALARERIAAGLKDHLTISLQSGTYFLPKPLVFQPADGGDETHRVTWVSLGGPAVLSGGRAITGWKQAGEHVWQAELEEVKAGKWYFRQLFVNGKRAVRARTPNLDADPRYDRLLDGTLLGDLSQYTLKVPPEKVRLWENLAEVEAVVLTNWATYEKRVQAVDLTAGLMTLAGPHAKYFSSNRPRKGTPFFVENAREFLDSPGEWYLDRASGKLTYWPREGEDLTKAEVVAPVLGRLVELAGTANTPLRNLHFRGLTFSHTDVDLPAGGHEGRQACFRYGGDGVRGWMNAAVQGVHIQGCSFRACTLAHLGGNGLDLHDGCQENVIEGNAVFDIEGNGLGVGGPNDKRLAPRANRIANNHVHRCGVRYFGAVGIWVGFSSATRVEHNLIHDLPYTGISVGWQWNPTPTVSGGHVIEANHIFDVMKEVSDGGGVYTLGFQPGTRICSNLIHDVQRSPFAHAAPNNGFFFDEGSKGFAVERNVIYRTAGKAVRFNQSQKDWHSWQDNVFLDEPKATLPSAHPAAEAGLEKEFQHLGQDGK